MTDDEILAQAQAIIAKRSAANAATVRQAVSVAPPVTTDPPRLPTVHSQHHFDIGKILGTVMLGASVAGGVFSNPGGFLMSMASNPQNLTSLLAGFLHIWKPELPAAPANEPTSQLPPALGT